jgi:hypothetical protein
MLMRQSRQPSQGSFLLLYLVLQKRRSGGSTAHTWSKHLEAVLSDPIDGVSGGLGQIELKRSWVVVKERGDVFQDLEIVGEDVDIVQVGQDESMRSQVGRELIQEGSYAKAEEQWSKGVSLSDPLRRNQEVLFSSFASQDEVSTLAIGPPCCPVQARGKAT